MALHANEFGQSTRPRGKVNEAMRQAIIALAAGFVCSITWDQDKEFSSHVAFTADTGVQVLP